MNRDKIKTWNVVKVGCEILKKRNYEHNKD